MVLQLVWVKVMVPETRGRALEQIEHDLGPALAGRAGRTASGG
jgi:hypothetical protein